MDRQNQSRGQPIGPQLLWAIGIVSLVFLIIVIGGYLFEWKWTGLREQSLWDWLDLLIVPVVLAIGGYLFTRSENLRTQQTAFEERTLDRQLAEERREDEMLQAFLDGMSQLLTDEKQPLHEAKLGDSLSTVARARTLTVLSRLGSVRKRSVVQFLYESGLIGADRRVLVLSGADLSKAALGAANLSKANLSGASLSEADLSGTDLSDADLSKVNLRDADLQGAILRVANLSRATLIGANLRVATLREATLSWANLKEADLSMANLIGADLSVANLRDAYLYGANLRDAHLRRATLSDAYLVGADLSGVNLRNAKGVTDDQLAEARSLEGATMPIGRKYKAWLKSKDRGETGTNE